MSQKLIMLFAVLMMILSLNAQRNRKSGENAVFYPVSRIVDGDTFWIDDGSEKGIKIRLTGIDAPETRNSRNIVSQILPVSPQSRFHGFMIRSSECVLHKHSPK